MAYGHVDSQGEARFKNELGKNTRDTVQKLCAIEQALTGVKTGADCNGNPISASGIQTIPHPTAVQLVKICPAANRDPEVVCISNDDGVTVVSGWEVFNISESGTVTSTLYLNGADVTATYKVVPCGIKAKYDYEIEKVCVDGRQWTKTYVYDPSSVDPTLVSILWLDHTDTPTTAPDIALINNANCAAPLSPTISDAFANDLSSLLSGNSFSITKPECCTLLVDTSIGTFRVIKGIKAYSTSEYHAPFTINSISIVSGNCTLDNVHIISNKTK